MFKQLWHWLIGQEPAESHHYEYAVGWRRWAVEEAIRAGAEPYHVTTVADQIVQYVLASKLP